MTKPGRGFERTYDMFFNSQVDRASAVPAPTRPSSAAHYLAQKLSHHVRLTTAERSALDQWLTRDTRDLGHRAVLVEQGAAPGEIHILLSGWACRYAIDDAGKRRIVAFYLPGDVCDFDVFLMRAIDQSIAAIGPARVAGINRAALNEISQSLPRVSRGLWWESLMTAAIQRAWTINAGHRSATRRIAHLLCELYLRLTLVGLAANGECELPLTQADIADACALTSVHTNRALQELRSSGLIALTDYRLSIRDWPALATFAVFDPSYLQIEEFCSNAEEQPVAVPV